MGFKQWLAVSFILVSPLSWAEPKLDLVALQQFFETGERLEATAEKYPALNETDDDFLLNGDNQALIDRLKSVGALEEVSAVVKQSGYESMEQYLNVTKRIMAALFAVQLEQTPEYSSAEAMEKMVEAQRKELVANGVSPEMVEQMMAGVNEQLEELAQLFEFAKKAQPDDIAVVRKNLDYVIRHVSEDAEGAAGEPAN